ncbi:MAG: response regulator transcription factor [candidate division WS1 bacterium]|jgi:DNA-binding response OmpR family regulator|nr:response regulator transcription factor [candidate division WS1 bacterium]
MSVNLPAILVVDDDDAIRRVVGAKLKLEGYTPIPVSTGQEAFRALEERQPHLIILDLGLPDIDGVTVCQRIRSRSSIPIIILSARSEEINRIVGLEIGADDYVTKPFSLDELMARVKAVLRRANPDRGFAPTETVIQVGDITIDTDGHEVTVARKRVDLTPTEFSLLSALAEKPGRVYSHQELLHMVWDYDQYDTHLVEVHIANLRRKIEKNPRKPHRVVTVRGVGYKLVPF